MTALAVLLGALLYLYTVSLHYTTILFYYTYILQVTEQLTPHRRRWAKRGQSDGSLATDAPLQLRVHEKKEQLYIVQPGNTRD